MRDLVLKLHSLEDMLKTYMYRDNTSDYFYNSIKQEYIALCDEIKDYIDENKAKNEIENNPFLNNVGVGLLSILELYYDYKNKMIDKDNFKNQLNILLYLYIKNKGE